MKTDKILSVIAGVMILVSILLTVIDGVCFAKSFYSYEYRKGNQAEYIGMSDEGLTESTDALLDYLRGKRDDIVVVTEVNGTEREVFNERETLHMADVRNLYRHAVTARNLLFVAGALIFVYLIMRDRNGWLSTCRTAFRGGLAVIAVFVGAIGIYAAADFYDFWMNFHYLFFDNDLFLLDPNTSIMINMFPESFFFDVVFLIILIYGLILLLMIVLMRILEKKEVGTA